MNDSLEATSNDYTLRRASSLSTNELNYQRTLASKLSAIKKSSSRIGHAETRKQHERSYESIRKDLLAKRHSGDSGQEAPTKPRSLRVRQNERQSSHSRTPSRRRSKKKSRAMRRRSSAPKMDAIQEEPTHSATLGNVDLASTDNSSCKQLTKDYVKLATLYQKQEPYRSNCCDPNAIKICLICKNESVLQKVFYPCQHQCVCDMCLMRHRVGSCSYGYQKSASNFCPLCREEIKLVLRSRGGRERKKYEDWVNEPKPAISSSFLRDFRVKSMEEIKWAMRTHEGINIKSHKSSTRTRNHHRHRQQKTKRHNPSKRRKPSRILPDISSYDDDSSDDSSVHDNYYPFKSSTRKWRKGFCVIS